MLLTFSQMKADEDISALLNIVKKKRAERQKSRELSSN